MIEVFGKLFSPTVFQSWSLLFVTLIVYARQTFFCLKAWFVLLKTNFWVNVKLYSEKWRVNSKTTQNELHYCRTAPLTKTIEHFECRWVWLLLRWPSDVPLQQNNLIALIQGKLQTQLWTGRESFHGWLVPDFKRSHDFDILINIRNGVTFESIHQLQSFKWVRNIRKASRS